MIEKVFTGSKGYWIWLASLLVVIAVGIFAYLNQLQEGLGTTGMSRDISWGFYIAQFTFLVGVAASAVMLVIPYYLHNYKKFGSLLVFGESLAVAAVLMCILFIMADLGRPDRVLNVMLYPTPNSILFWDMIVLNGYLGLNLVIVWMVMDAERRGVQVAKWVKPLIYLSIPWAFSIHTVTAFLYAGLPGRPLWMTAILAPRFLASAFAAGPALLLLLIMLVQKLSKFRADADAMQTLGKIVLYGMIANVFFYGLEFFTAFYSNIPSHSYSLQYLFFGLDGHNKLVGVMWVSVVLGFAGIALLIFPAMRQKQGMLALAAAAIFISTWIDKGLGLVIGGFIPSPLEHITEYSISMNELLVSLAIFAIGALVLTLFYKIALGIKEEVAS